MRSTTQFSGDVSEIAFEVVQTFDEEGNESTLGYWNGKLVVVGRPYGSYTRVYESSGLEGTGTFTKHNISNHIMHSPAINLVNTGDYLLVAGGKLIGAVRKPYILMFDENFNVVSAGCVDDTVDSYGGYPSFVRISREKYGMVYYSESSEGGTDLFFREANINYVLNTAYYPF